jgi:hypothetical protein
MRIMLVTAVALALAIGLQACAEKEQTALYKDGKYRGKPDGRPWDNTPPPATTAGGWRKGDHSGWENQLRSRNAGQNENQRIGR